MATGRSASRAATSAHDVYAVFGQKQGGESSFTANLGKGDDDADVDLAGNVSSAADVRIELNGAAGKDTLSSSIGYLTVGSVDISFDSRSRWS